ncbi:MAG: diguanylate cyclase [Desulfobulbaceae bacterium]
MKQDSSSFEELARIIQVDPALTHQDTAGCQFFLLWYAEHGEHHRKGGIVIRITISVGVSTRGSGMASMDKSQLIYAADSAMYQAKQNGRNRVGVMKLQG